MRKAVILLLFTTSLISGCAGLIVAGAAASGGYAYYKQDEMRAYQTDQKTKKRLQSIIKQDPIFHGSHIMVAISHHIVLLVGQTPEPLARAKIEKITQKISGIDRIYNEITINSPTSTLTRTSDSWITAKVKSQLLAAKHLPSNDIKVLTENGTVFLLGKVDREDADRAVDVARRVIGVQKVVKAFIYY